MVGRFHLDSLTSSVYVIDINAPARIRKLAGGGQPAWSPDGRKIAFVAPGGSLAPDHVGLFVMNADGTGARRITSPNDATQCTEGSSATDLKPNWSPDGSRIVFERDIHTDADGGFDCGLDGWGYVPRAHVVNADGTGLRRVMPVTSWGDGDPVWSPDGRSIALTSSCCGLAIIDAEGIGPARTVLQQFTFPGRFQLSPAWSPDGKYLLFVNVSQPYNQLFVVEVASGRARPIDIGVPGSIIDASWSPIR